MIQRIQSVYLFFAGLVLFALFVFPVITNLIINGLPDSLMVNGIYEVINGVRTKTTTFVPLSIATVAAGLLPLIGIFMYKDRKMQKSYCYIVIVLIIGYSFYMTETIKTIAGGGEVRPENFSLGAILPSISIVLIIFAIRGINKDEKLLKSAERLR